MLQPLFFKIAEHYLKIETQNPEKALEMLPSYAPFRVEEPQEVLPKSILSVTFDQEDPNVDLPEAIDVFDWDNIDYALYTTGEGKWYLRMTSQGVTTWLWTENEWKNAYTTSSLIERSKSKFSKMAITSAFAMSLAFDEGLKLHASVTELNGKALIFFGVSGTGKSTHSRLWREFVPGCSLLNDDEPIIRLEKDGSVRVYGAPWSGSTPCYRNESAEVVAFVHLYQSPENRLTRLRGFEAYYSLLSSSNIMRKDPDNKKVVMDLALRVVNKIPVYRLDCRPDEEAVSLTRSIMEGNPQTEQ